MSVSGGGPGAPAAAMASSVTAGRRRNWFGWAALAWLALGVLVSGILEVAWHQPSLFVVASAFMACLPAVLCVFAIADFLLLVKGHTPLDVNGPWASFLRSRWWSIPAALVAGLLVGRFLWG